MKKLTISFIYLNLENSMNNIEVLKSLKEYHPYSLLKMYDQSQGIIVLGKIPVSQLTEELLKLCDAVEAINTSLDAYSWLVNVNKHYYKKINNKWVVKKSGYNCSLTLEERKELCYLPSYQELYGYHDFN